jgi:hypothetical protein
MPPNIDPKQNDLGVLVARRKRAKLIKSSFWPSNCDIFLSDEIRHIRLEVMMS